MAIKAIFRVFSGIRRSEGPRVLEPEWSNDRSCRWNLKKSRPGAGIFPEISGPGPAFFHAINRISGTGPDSVGESTSA
jgi:hypothetical protein